MTVDQQGVGTGGSVSVEDFKGKLADIEPGVGYIVGEAEQFPWPQTPDEVRDVLAPLQAPSRRSRTRRSATSARGC